MNILVNQIGWECIIRLDGIYKHTSESDRMGVYNQVGWKFMNILANQIGWESIIRLDGIYKHTSESDRMGVYNQVGWDI